MSPSGRLDHPLGDSRLPQFFLTTRASVGRLLVASDGRSALSYSGCVTSSARSLRISSRASPFGNAIELHPILAFRCLG